MPEIFPVTFGALIVTAIVCRELVEVADDSKEIFPLQVPDIVKFSPDGTANLTIPETMGAQIPSLNLLSDKFVELATAHVLLQASELDKFSWIFIELTAKFLTCVPVVKSNSVETDK